jgi:hypothetical protein
MNKALQALIMNFEIMNTFDYDVDFNRIQLYKKQAKNMSDLMQRHIDAFMLKHQGFASVVEFKDKLKASIRNCDLTLKQIKDKQLLDYKEEYLLKNDDFDVINFLMYNFYKKTMDKFPFIHLENLEYLEKMPASQHIEKIEETKNPILINDAIILKYDSVEFFETETIYKNAIISVAKKIFSQTDLEDFTKNEDR